MPATNHVMWHDLQRSLIINWICCWVGELNSQWANDSAISQKLSVAATQDQRNMPLVCIVIGPVISLWDNEIWPKFLDKPADNISWFTALTLQTWSAQKWKMKIVLKQITQWSLFLSLHSSNRFGPFEELYEEVVHILRSIVTFKTVFVPWHFIHRSIRLDISIMRVYIGANVLQIRALEASSYVLAFAMLSWSWKQRACQVTVSHEILKEFLTQTAAVCLLMHVHWWFTWSSNCWMFTQ